MKVLRELKKFDQALEWIQKLLELDASASNYRQKAHIVEALDKPEEALEIIERSIQIEPENIENYEIKAKILEKLKKREDALELVRKVVDLQRRDEHDYYRVARLLREIRG